MLKFFELFALSDSGAFLSDSFVAIQAFPWSSQVSDLHGNSITRQECEARHVYVARGGQTAAAGQLRVGERDREGELREGV